MTEHTADLRRDHRNAVASDVIEHRAGWVCTAQPCLLGHPGHPGMGHCSGCIDERNEGYMDLSLFTMRDDEPVCCCRDNREPIR